MDSDYHIHEKICPSLDYDNLFTSASILIILLILGLTQEDCADLLRDWLLIKGSVLTFRLSIKSGFSLYKHKKLFQIIIALTRVFSFVWVILGTIWLYNETACHTGIYIGTITFIIIYSIGLAGFIGISLAITLFSR